MTGNWTKVFHYTDEDKECIRNIHSINPEGIFRVQHVSTTKRPKSDKRPHAPLHWRTEKEIRDGTNTDVPAKLPGDKNGQWGKPALPKDLLEKWLGRHDTEKTSHIFGATPGHYGLVLLDLDKRDDLTIEEMESKVIAKYGQPLEHITSFSGGTHLVYPIPYIKKPYNESLDEALDYGTQYFIDGIKYGEVCCTKQYAVIWDPHALLAAIEKRQVMDDADKLLSSNIIDNNVQDKEQQSKDNQKKATEVNEDDYYTAFNELIKGRTDEICSNYLNLKWENHVSTYIGRCTWCDVIDPHNNQTGTRFKVFFNSEKNQWVPCCHYCHLVDGGYKHLLDIIKGYISASIPPEIKDLIENTHDRIVIAALERMTPKNIAYTKESLITGCRSLAYEMIYTDNQTIPLVDTMIQGALVCGVAQDDTNRIRAQYINELRPQSKVRAKGGDFPHVMHHLEGEIFDHVLSVVKSNVRKHGGYMFNETYRFQSSDNQMKAIRATGANLYWSVLDEALIVQHDNIDILKEGAISRRPDNFGISALLKGMERTIVQPKTITMGKPAKEYYIVTPAIPNTSSSAIANNLVGFIGSEIPRVDQTEDTTREYLRRIEKMSDNEKFNAQLLTHTWLTDLHNKGIIEIFNHNNQKVEILASYISMIIYTTFGHRRIQHLPEYKSRIIFQQKHVPLFIGVTDSFKTTLCKLLLPDDGIYTNRRNESFVFQKDINMMHRDLVGNLLVICDELSGLKSTPTDISKSVISSTQSIYNEKHEKNVTYTRSDVMVANTNRSGDIPFDEALRNRFLPIAIGPGSCDNPRQALIDWFDKNRDQLIVGGLIQAINQTDITPPRKLDGIRNEILIHQAKSSNTYAEDIIDIINQGKLHSRCIHPKKGPILTEAKVLLKAGELKYQRNIDMKYKKGDVIPYVHEEHEFHDYIIEAYKSIKNTSSTAGKIKRLQTVMKSIMGHDVDEGRFHIDVTGSMNTSRARIGFVPIMGSLKESEYFQNDD